MSRPRPRLAIAAGIIWRSFALGFAVAGLVFLISVVGDRIAKEFPNPPPCYEIDCFEGDDYE